MHKPKVLIVDDHPIVRTAVRTILERDNYEVAEAHDGAQAVEMARKLEPEAVILDLGLQKLDGVSVLTRLRKLDLPPRIVVLTGQPKSLYAQRCIEAGASAFVEKDDDLDILKAALKAVLAGYSYLPANINQNTEHERLDSLSDRELEVLRLLVRGKNNEYIAEAMNLSPKTVSTYKTRIQEKLDATSIVEIYEIAKRHKLN